MMATKTIINCMDQTATLAPSTGLSIIIDQDKNKQLTNASSNNTINNNNSNIIMIQHSCQESTLNSNNNNKLLIDINRNNSNNKQVNADDHQHHQQHHDQKAQQHNSLKESERQTAPLVSPAIVKINCTTSNEYASREMMKASEKPLIASVKLETTNGYKATTARDYNRERNASDDNDVVDDEAELHHRLVNHEHHLVGQEKEQSLANNQESSKYHKESSQTAMIHNDNNRSSSSNTNGNTFTNNAIGATTATITTTTTTTTSQQVNGNSKCRENNGHFSINQPKIETASNNSTTSNGQENYHHHHHDDNDDYDLHHNARFHKDQSNSNDDDHHQQANDYVGHNVAQFIGIGKRDSLLDISHAKQSDAEENSNSLLTKADTATTHKQQTPTTSLNISENSSKENCNFHEKPTATTQAISEQINENSTAHVVKIQINPKTSLLEKQISIVKIETANDQIKPLKENLVSQEKIVTKIEEEIEKNESLNQNIAPNKSENLLSESVLDKSVLKLNLETMVQKPHPAATVAGSSTPSTTNNNHMTSTSATTGSTSVTELNVTNPNYLYYMMSSGQFSPCDTLDSGTGSDLEMQQHSSTQNSPHNHHGMLTMKSSTNSSMNGLEMHLKTTKIRVSNSSKEQRNCSFTDSEESEASSLSCDSLHSSEFMRQSSASPINNKTPSPSSKILGAYLPDSLLRDIKNLKFSSTDYEADQEHDQDHAEIEHEVVQQRSKSSHKKHAYEPISSQDYMLAKNDYVQTRNTINSNGTLTNNSNHNTPHNTNNSASQQHLSNSMKRASMPSKTFVLNQEDGTFIDMKMNSMPRKYEADKYYDFHVNEHANFRSFGNNSSTNIGSFAGDGDDSLSNPEYDSRIMNEDVFAGYKDIRCGSNTSTIRSSKGTVRGVKNRVRNGIATFLQMQHPNLKNFKEKDSGKVVLYTTSMGIIRDTYAKCSNVKQILRTLLVKFEERDVFMSVEYQAEIKERMHSEIIKVPQLFVEGQHIGDADTVERLNESGELRQLLKPYKSIATTFTCQTCGGYRLLPCPSCNGSKKSVHRNHFTAEFVALKCMNCDEVGLVKCHNC